MGQAVVDLPDPMDAPPPTSLSGTDDLLAQLAGDEIDRLLAESDDGRAAFDAAASARKSGTPSDPAQMSSVQPAAAALPSAQPDPASVAVDALPAGGSAYPPISEASQVAVPNPVAPAVPPQVAAALAMDAELDALLNDLEEGGSAPARPAATAGTGPGTLVDQVPSVLAQFGAAIPVEPSGADDAATGVSPAEEVPGAVMSVAERDALSLSDLATETDVAEHEDAVAAAAALEAATPPRIRAAIRALEIFNAPLAFVPDSARDLLGKAAILTLVNAAAVLIYVLFVRH